MFSSVGKMSFFFFKQKTAYERRISDWSSDVCSSDLVPITHVFETHIHNDYVTGGLVLAERCGAAYVVNADDPVGFERHGIRDGEVIATGTLEITAIHTPGHTPTHMSYAVGVDGDPAAVFTGGSVLYGAMGRTDLVRSEEHTSELQSLMRTSYAVFCLK